MDFYVYQYVRKSNGLPYYIGKGRGKRAWCPHGSVSVPKDLTKIQIISENMTEADALKLEKDLIAKYGRKDLGNGILLNKTDGGEGLSNPGPETRQKMIDNIKTGRTGMTNRVHSKETKSKMSESAKRRGFTEEQRRKIGEARRGKKEDAEAGKRRGEAISKAKKGKSNGHEGLKHSEETKSKIAAQKGWKHSDETRKKMSELQRERCSNMTDEERKQRYGHCAGKPWSEARRAAYLLNKEKKNG
jgi:hypothetical protein